MNLREQMAKDVQRVFGNTGEFGENVLVTPLSSSLSFAITITRGDPQQSIELSDRVQRADDIMQIIVSRETWRAGMRKAQGQARDAIKGDKITVPATSDMAGDWFVEDSIPDEGGAINISLTRRRAYGVGAQVVD